MIIVLQVSSFLSFDMMDQLEPRYSATEPVLILTNKYRQFLKIPARHYGLFQIQMLYVFPAGTVQSFSLAHNKHSMNVTVYIDYRRLVTQTLLLIATSTSQIRLPTALKESQSSKMLNYTILFIKDYTAIKFAFHHYESASEASTLSIPIFKACSSWIKMDCFNYT